MLFKALCWTADNKSVLAVYKTPGGAWFRQNTRQTEYNKARFSQSSLLNNRLRVRPLTNQLFYRQNNFLLCFHAHRLPYGDIFCGLTVIICVSTFQINIFLYSTSYSVFILVSTTVCTIFNSVLNSETSEYRWKILCYFRMLILREHNGHMRTLEHYQMFR